MQIRACAYVLLLVSLVAAPAAQGVDYSLDPNTFAVGRAELFDGDDSTMDVNDEFFDFAQMNSLTGQSGGSILDRSGIIIAEIQAEFVLSVPGDSDSPIVLTVNAEGFIDEALDASSSGFASFTIEGEIIVDRELPFLSTGDDLLEFFPEPMNGVIQPGVYQIFSGPFFSLAGPGDVLDVSLRQTIYLPEPATAVMFLASVALVHRRRSCRGG